MINHSRRAQFSRPLLLAALLSAGSAWAQEQNSDNPHSIRAKDKQGSDTPASTTSQEANQAEKGNPNSTDSSSPKPSVGASNPSFEAAERGNPNSVQNKDREKLGAGLAGPEQMGDMDHDEMMNHATPAMMLQRLHLSNLHEIDLGKIAELNGTDRIRGFAHTLVRDHQNADVDVQAVARNKSIALSDTLTNPEMQRHLQLARDWFSGLEGTGFDRSYLTRMSIEHKRVMALAQTWVQDCKDPEVCSLIRTLIPKLQQQAQVADQLRAPEPLGRNP